MSTATTIVVPCYNEADRLDGEAFLRFALEDSGFSFLFVNDGSGDGTGPMLRELAERLPGQLMAHDLPKNSGKAEAVRQGMRLAMSAEAAARLGEPAVVGFFDADLATPLEALPKLRGILADRSDIDMVFGSRVNLLGREVRRKLLRHWIGRIFATLASGVLGLPIYDTQCGAKLFRADDDLRVVLQSPFLSRWIFDVELIARYLVRAEQLGKRPVRERIYEYPLLRWVDVAGSKLKMRDSIRVGLDLWRIRWRYFTGERPDLRTVADGGASNMAAGTEVSAKAEGEG